jgi:ABC-type uncharacterized transport system ATPase component
VKLIIHLQHVLNAGILSTVKNVLKTGSANLAKECCWMLSNIMAGTRDQIQVVRSLIKRLKRVFEKTLKTVFEKTLKTVFENRSVGRVYGLKNIQAEEMVEFSGGMKVRKESIYFIF